MEEFGGGYLRQSIFSHECQTGLGNSSADRIKWYTVGQSPPLSHDESSSLRQSLAVITDATMPFVADASKARGVQLAAQAVQEGAPLLCSTAKAAAANKVNNLA